MPGPGDPNDKPGLADVIKLFKDNFSAGTWELAFRETVRVSLNYLYDDKNNGH